MLAQFGLPGTVFSVSAAAPVNNRTAITPVTVNGLLPTDRFTKFGHAIVMEPGDVVRLDSFRLLKTRGIKPPTEKIVDCFEAMIPPAGDMQLKKRLSNASPDDFQEYSFNRAERIAAFYLLLALTEHKAPVEDPDMRLAGLRQLILAVENKATEKVAPQETDSHIFTEDPRVMQAQFNDRQAFLLENGKVIPPDYKISDESTAFPKENSILVIPSTREYTIIDKQGRVMVLRMDPACIRNYPYKHLKAPDINEALASARIVFSIPKPAQPGEVPTDILGRSLSGIYIAPEWQVASEILEKLPDWQKEQIQAVLRQIPGKPFEKA